MAQNLELASRPGAGLSELIGSLNTAPNAPTDLAARHDKYLYPTDDDAATRSR